MPRLRQKQNFFEAKVKYYSNLNHVPLDKLSKLTKISLPTIYKRLSTPSKVTVGELMLISRALRCDINDLFECAKKL